MLDMIRDLLAMTAWEMAVPKAYGPLHLSFTLIGFVVSFFAAYKLRNLKTRQSNILIFSVGAFLILCEIYKQLMYEMVIEPGLPYRWGNFSFQLCSIPMYLCMIIPFLKPGRLQRAMCGFLMTFNLLGGFISFFEPSGLLHGHWTLTFHALIWHMSLVFLGAYIAFSGRGCNDKKSLKDCILLFLGLCCIAFSLNCGFRKVSEGNLNLFFIGPSNSPLIVFKQISQWFGWYVSTLLYIPCVCAGASIFYLVFRWLNTKILSRSQKNTGGLTVSKEDLP